MSFFATLFKISSFKICIAALVGLALFGLVPDWLYSQPSSIAFGQEIASSPYNEIAATQNNKSITPNRAKTTPTGSTGAHPLTTATTITPGASITKPSLVSQSLLLVFMGLLPFIIMVLTSFLKIVVVLSLLRTALGVQQAPPNQVINGVAFLLSLFVMYPTVSKMYDAAKVVIDKQGGTPESILSSDASTYVIEVVTAAREPFREFLKKNSSSRHQALFYRLVYRGLPEEYRTTLEPSNFIVLVPSFITSQLKDAFEIGVLIYIPFFVIDLVTSNILLAMGMMMLSPVTISMPLKLFLLVMLDGWTILIEGLIKTFV